MIVRPVCMLLCVGIFLILLQSPRVQGGSPKINGKGLRDEMTYKRKYYNLLQSAKERELLESLHSTIRYKELSEQLNADAKDEVKDDYAKERDDVNFMDKSVKAMKRGKDDEIIKDAPCTCNSRIEREFIGDNAFPKIVETIVCSETQPLDGCKPPYVCQENKYDLKVLKWKRMQQGTQAELPNSLGKDWSIEIKPISVGCICLRDYSYKTEI